MENIRKLSISTLRQRWKTILVLVVVAGSSFMVGAYANRVFVGLIQSIAGSRALVPPPELQIMAAVWSIDAKQSLVTDVDLLVTTKSAVWQLKLYAVYVQVSCLDETVTPPREFICSTGTTRIVLPTHGIGLRRLHIILDRPINPETIEIHDLSFIVTDLGRVPPQPPTVFGGPLNPQLVATPGSTLRIPVTVVGVSGVSAGTQVEVRLEATEVEPWVDSPPPQTLTLQASTRDKGVVMADSFFDVFVADTALIGLYEIRLTINGPNLQDVALIDVDITPRIPLLPNLRFPNCPADPTFGSGDAGIACLGPIADIGITFQIDNNGVAPTTVAVDVTVEFHRRTCTPGVGCTPLAPVILTLAPIPAGFAVGAVTERSVDAATMSANCSFDPDCFFTLRVDPANVQPELNESDNDHVDGILG